METIYKVDFFKNENKNPKSLVLISLTFICFCLGLTIYYLVEIRQNYKGWTSYLRLTTPVLMATLIYLQSTGKGIFKRHFILTNQEILWTFSFISGTTTLKWTDIYKIDITKSEIQFYLTNDRPKKITLNNFTYNQLMELKEKLRTICLDSKIQTNIV
jgi:hypothetical protein